MEAIGIERMRAEISAMLPQEDLTLTSVRQLRTKLEAALGFAEGDMEPRKAEVHALIQEEVIRFLLPTGAGDGEEAPSEVDEEERERRRAERRAARKARREAREQRRKMPTSRKAQIAARNGKPPPALGRKSAGFGKGKFTGKAVLKKPQAAKAKTPAPQKPQGPKERKTEAVPEAQRQELWDKWMALHGDTPLADLPDLPAVWGYEDVPDGAEAAGVEEACAPMDVDAEKKTQGTTNMAKLASPMRSRMPDPLKVPNFEEEAVSE